MEKQVVIGTVIAPHGVRGDIRIMPHTDRPEQFLKLKTLLLSDGSSLKITSARFHKSMVLMKCQGVDTMNDADLLRGKKVLINSEDLPKLGEGEYYVADLIGLPCWTWQVRSSAPSKTLSAPAATTFTSSPCPKAKTSSSRPSKNTSKKSTYTTAVSWSNYLNGQRHREISFYHPIS